MTDAIEKPSPTRPRLFLSYARGDDEAFARRLYEDLTASGFDVWFDRESLPSRDLTFHQEIEDAIRTRDRLIYIGGPKAAASAYVRQEWQFAVAADKVVIPLLRLGKYETAIPDGLALRHCEDFRDDAEYARQFKKLLGNLHRPAPPLGRLHAVPEPPANVIGRGDLLIRVRDALLVDLQKPQVMTGADARVGVQGMGGVGKSVLAAVMARDHRVRQSYPDGIIWVAVGKQPDVPALQRNVAHALGSDEGIANTQQGKSVLEALLKDKAVLLVLDDVWQSVHAEAFAVLGPRCRLLITSRNLNVAQTLAGEQFQVGLFSETEALQLLADKVGMDRLSLPADAHAVIAECGCLPLALALCGAMAKKRSGDFTNVLRRLQQADLDKIADPSAIQESHRDIWRALHISVEDLAADMQRRFAELAVFPPGRVVPQEAVETLWSHTGGLDALDAEDLLIDLHERALVQVSVAAECDIERNCDVSLHDLIHDYASLAVGNLEDLHGQYAAASLNLYRTAPDRFAGFIKKHLPTHLMAAGNAPQLLSLLGDTRLNYFNQWAEQGMAAEGVSCLKYLIQYLDEHAIFVDLSQVLGTQIARLYNRLGEPRAAERWLHKVIGSNTELPRNRLQIVALHELASVFFSEGEHLNACREFRRALRGARRHEPPLGGEIAANLIGLAGATYLVSLRSSRVIRLGQLALHWAEIGADAPHTAEACRILADVHKDNMEYTKADSYLSKGLHVAQRHNLVAADLSLRTCHAWMYYHQAVLGDRSVADSESLFRELHRKADSSGDTRVAGDAWSGLGQVAILERSRTLLEQAIANLSWAKGNRLRPNLDVRCRMLEGARCLWSAAFTDAMAIYEQCQAISLNEQLRARQVDAIVGQGIALYRMGRKIEAESKWNLAIAKSTDCPTIRQHIAAHSIARSRDDKDGCPL